MFKKIGLFVVLLHVVSVPAKIGIDLKIQHGKAFIQEPYFMEDHQFTGTLDRGDLVIVLDKEHKDENTVILSTKVYTKDAESVLTLVANPVLVLRRGHEAKITAIDRRGNEVPDKMLSVLAIFQ